MSVTILPRGIGIELQAQRGDSDGEQPQENVADFASTRWFDHGAVRTAPRIAEDRLPASLTPQKMTSH
jgi:hypothetical protein